MTQCIDAMGFCLWKSFIWILPNNGLPFTDHNDYFFSGYFRSNAPQLTIILFFILYFFLYLPSAVETPYSPEKCLFVQHNVRHSSSTLFQQLPIIFWVHNFLSIKIWTARLRMTKKKSRHKFLDSTLFGTLCVYLTVFELYLKSVCYVCFVAHPHARRLKTTFVCESIFFFAATAAVAAAIWRLHRVRWREKNSKKRTRFKQTFRFTRISIYSPTQICLLWWNWNLAVSFLFFANLCLILEKVKWNHLNGGGISSITFIDDSPYTERNFFFCFKLISV